MQGPRALHLVQLAADLRHPFADQSPVGLDLRFARTAEEAESASLTFEVGPAPDQPACLVIQMRKLDLKTSLCGSRPLSENLEDQGRPVDHLGADFVLQVLLLNGSERRI